MTILTNPFDAPELVRARETQTDPLVMYLVVRREQATDVGVLAEAAAEGVVRCALAYATDPAHAADFAAWNAMSFRKVTLRANDKDWAKLMSNESALVTVDDPAGMPIVAVLPPRPKSSVSPFLRSLQAYVVAPRELDRGGARAVDENVSSIVIVADPILEMSAGKLLAQIGHAALMAERADEDLGADPGWAGALAAWRAAGRRFVFVEASPSGYLAALETFDAVVVTDSGLTEVAPGSRTIAAFRPASGADLGDLTLTLAAG